MHTRSLTTTNCGATYLSTYERLIFLSSEFERKVKIVTVSQKSQPSDLKVIF